MVLNTMYSGSDTCVNEYGVVVEW